MPRNIKRDNKEQQWAIVVVVGQSLFRDTRKYVKFALVVDDQIK